MNKAAYRLLVWLSSVVCMAAAPMAIIARAQEPGTGFYEPFTGQPAMAAPASASADSACQVTLRTTLPLQLIQGHFVTPLSVNSRTLPMTVDTGSARTTVAAYLEDSLGLQPNYRRRSVSVVGVGGTSRPHQGMTAHSVLFGPSHLLDYNLTLVDISRPNSEATEGKPVGQIGADLLSTYDIEFDFPKHEMRLYSVSGCKGDFVPWVGPHHSFHALRNSQNAMLIPIALNRHPLLALVDTGAAITTVTRKAALAAGIDPAMLDQEKLSALRGVGHQSVPMHLHRFDTMQVGSGGFRNIPVWVQDGDLKDADMLLGLSNGGTYFSEIDYYNPYTGAMNGGSLFNSQTGGELAYYSNTTWYGGRDFSFSYVDGYYADEDQCFDGSDPVILNLSGQGVQTQSVTDSNAIFDMRNDGHSIRTGWATAGEGMLVYDPDNTGAVKDDADLVGGFDALKKMDSNGDGKLNADDADWSALKVWVDSNGTGQFNAGSLYSMAQLGIASIDLNATPVNRQDNGNTILDDGTFQWTSGATGDIAGVSLMFDSGPLTARPVDPAAAAQLNRLVNAMAGFGVPASAQASLAAANDPQIYAAPLLAAAH